MKKILAFAALVSGAALSFNALAGGNLEAGKSLVEKGACAGCHGADLNSPNKINTADDSGIPRLAGQPQDYLEHALMAYKHADGPTGRASPMMEPMVKSLTKEQIRDIAAYIHSLPGSLQVRR